MKGETNSAGFTIVETLLVLAVTGALFVMVVLAFGGRQGKAQFQQSVRDIQTRVQQTMNEVSSGYYPNTQDFKCASVGGVPVITASATTVDQGTNADCIFLGKIMQFSVNSGNTEQYNTYSVAGLRNATTLLASKPTLIWDSANAIKVTSRSNLAYGLTTKSMYYYDSSGQHPTNAMGFISKIGSLSDSGTYEAGAVDMLAVTGTSLTSDESTTVNAINASHLSTAAVNPSGGVTICFQSGTDSETALLSIGSNGHDLAVKLEIKACS